MEVLEKGDYVISFCSTMVSFFRILFRISGFINVYTFICIDLMIANFN